MSRPGFRSIRPWVHAIGCAALLFTGGAVARPLPPVRSAAVTGLLKVAIAGRTTSVRVALAHAEVDPENDHVVTSLGTRGSFLLLADSYASRGQTMSRCQAGHETWVRLIDTRARAERWSKRVESCLHDVEPDSPVAAWDDTGTSFTVNLVSEPSLHVSVRPDGRISTGD